MKIRRRLDRVAQALARRLPPSREESDLFARTEGYAAWLAHRGPEPPLPPCPPGLDGEAWGGQMGFTRTLGRELRCDLGPGEYLPGSTVEQAQRIEGQLRMVSE